ncbi:MAG: gamma-glutamyltransferase [Acidobacteriaceae bacterium]|nr:gamma-glutamyltransferase [Acidobacteriaceae bacterium]MBV9294281.1 gamma-glutamyltransferase [Acidobacteriaceae bacterium]MBV9764417.1 gamma-glutamyltransferase [Acidobacteriaceae bacterium]
MIRIVSPCLLAPYLFISALSAKTPVQAKHGMVVAQEPLAADAGLTVLKSGGNAIDAAIAVGFALAVTHPVAGNIGGGGFMLIRLADGRTAFLDFRECAPKKATRDMYIGSDGNPTRESIVGWRSSGVPGTIAGFETARQKYGSKRWANLVAPAIKLAREGFLVSDDFAASLRGPSNPLQLDPESRRIFLRNGRPYDAGETLKQPELASTLERIAANGAKEFYQGETARQLAAAMQANGGLITEADLRDYKTIERNPLNGDYKEFHVITSPPPSAGGVGLLQMMGMLEGTDYDSAGPDSPKAVHYEAEAMRRFYADRSEYLGDPDFYNVPVRQLLDKKYLNWRRGTIDATRATPSDIIGPGLPKSLDARVSWKESEETTHYNVVDEKGNAVAVTYTLNNSYGNGITAPGLGFLLNDEMDDFAAKPGAPNMFGMLGSDANAIEPGKRPLSSMMPTIITKNGRLFMVAGAPGGARITTGVTEVILDVLDFHMNAQDAVDLPRFHEQWKPDVLYLQDGFPKENQEALRKMGYEVKPTNAVARVEAIVVDNGILAGGTESRLHGKVSGY